MKKKAIALRYPKNATAPFISAKGRGELAEKMLRIAKDFNVPIKKSIPLADILTIQEVGTYVPPETYEVVAKIFAFVAKHKG